MNELQFVAYLPDPFGVRESAYRICSLAGLVSNISSAELSGSEAICVTYDSSVLVEDLSRRSLPPPRQLIDLGTALRLCAGIPRDEGRDRRTNLWSALSAFFPTTRDVQLFESVVESRCDRPDAVEIQRLLELAVQAVRGLWLRTADELKINGEFDRFMLIEVPVQGIFNYRQYAGINVDSDIAAALIQEAADEKYLAYTAIASALNRNPTGLNFWNIREHLIKTDVAPLAGIEDGGRLREAFKIAAFNSKFASDFLSFVDASRDELILMRSAGRDQRLYPVFHVLGTVTGRILVSDPYLQQLRRKYRKLVSADEGSRLVYLDYCQFEPGILAFLTEDQRLIEAYNQGDLYTALSVAIFGDESQRVISKRIFLAFCYGMSTDRIAKLVKGQGGAHEGISAAIDSFFSAFPGLGEFRTKAESELLRNGFASSLCGNRRWRTGRDALSSKERRWALNQPVQSTASLIFKEAVIDLEARYGRGSILLPVHDAVLMQFRDDDQFDSKVALSKQVMLDAFVRRCPGIRAQISSGSFSD